MKRKQWKKIGTLILFLALAAFALSGCSGSDGSAGATGVQGPAGPAGPQGPAGQVVVNPETLSAAELSALTLKGEITSVTIASAPVVNFFITDANGNGITGLGTKNTAAIPSLNNLRFAIAKLVPGVNGSPDKWVSYIVTSTATPPVASRPSTDSTGTIVDHGDGTYTYTFYRDLATIKDTAGVTDVTYEPALTHRLAIQISGTVPGAPAAFSNPINLIKDFVPAGGAVVAQREITTTAACNSCHGAIGTTTPHGGRVDARYCVVCHTDQRKIGRTNVASVGGVFAVDARGYMLDGEVVGDMPIMIHKIHMGSSLVKTGAGYNYAGGAADFNFPLMAYPQDRTNCRKCHTASAAAPQGDNWKNKPSRMACGACHDGIDWATGTGTTVNGATTGHIGGRATSDALCTICHTAVDIDAIYHVTDNATPNNPNVPTGAVNFTYEISSVTVSASDQPVVKFRILKNGTAVTFNAYAAGAALLTGFSGSPSFLVAYADGTDTTVDYNNKGKTAAQPATVSITNAWNGTQGTLSVPDVDGYYTATLDGSANAARFPVGAKLRAVALQGYFTQTAGTGGIAANTARHTVSVIKNVTGDVARREVVDSAKCGQCHEWFEGHGGNRVYTVAVCVTCHNPNLSTSGRAANIANMSASNVASITADGYAAAVATDVLNFPEASNNMKEMIHGIHASALRTNQYRFVRDRGTSGVYYYNWGHVVYPSILNKCETCHKPGTYGSVPSGALATTNVTTGVSGATWSWSTGSVTGGEAAVADVATARGGAALPGANNLVISPFAGACVFCHDSAAARSHMAANGGQLNVARSVYTAGTEQCAICHGPGRSADAAAAHVK